MHKKKFFVIILNFNGIKNTIECLESFKNVRIPQGVELEVAVIDNASIDNTISVMNKDFPEVKLIENNENLGFSGGNNIGINYALKQGADYIMILNNDTLVERDTIFELYQGFKTKEADVVSPKIYFEKGFEYHKERYKDKEKGKVFWYAGGEMDWNNVIGHHRGVDEVDYGQYDKKTELESITGACFVAKAEVFKKAGVFDDSFFLYYEDADLSMRIIKNSFKIKFVPSAIVYHKNAGSTGGSGSTLQDYFITRNRLIFGLRYAPLRARIALIRESITLLFSGRKWQKRGVLDFYTRQLGKGTYPLPE